MKCKPKNKEKPIFRLTYDPVRYIPELLTDEYNLLRKRVYENKKHVKDIFYLDLICTLDIETSSFLLGDRKCAVMYCWQFGINGKGYIGRTWEEFEKLIEKLKIYYDLSDDRRLIIWVQNLSYEFQWIYKRFNFVDVFARSEREPMKANTDDGFEYRCSYVLSGCSLATMAKNLTMFDIRKLVGDLDYNIIHSPQTPLTKKEISYCMNDILIVMAYIYEQVTIYGDLLHIPMTNTGRVRKECRKVCLGRVWGKRYRNLMQKCVITDEAEYNALRRAFQGGFTHANWKRVNEIIENVYSRDFTSSYPTVMIAEKYPMGKAEKLNGLSVEDLEQKRVTHKIVFNVRFHNLREKPDVYDNPLSVSKCNISGRHTENNGRLMSADVCTTTLTDVDFFDIIRGFYDWDKVEIGTCWCYPASYLPTPLVDLILSLYEDKTTLKDIVEKVIEYLLKKGMLNSVYGCTVMALISTLVKLVDGEWKTEEETDIAKVIDNYNNDMKRFLFYPWGVFVTAYARRNLFTGIKELGADYIYADTDSVKFTNLESHEAYFKRYNEWIQKKLEIALKCHKLNPERLRPKTVEGEEKPLGVWDDDGTYLKFKTLGAKRYMYLANNKKRAKKENKPQCLEIHTTVAGVSKSGLAEYLTRVQRHYKGNSAFDFFTDEMHVPAKYAHKMTAYYEDNEVSGEAVDYLGHKFTFHEKSFVYMHEGDYNMKLADLYKLLLFQKEKYML